MKPSPRTNSKYSATITFLLIVLSLSMTGAAKSEFYDTNFDSTKPPVYLKGVLGEEPVISKITVRSVVPGSPAAKSGLRRGDEIVSFGGDSLNRSARILYQSLFHLYETQSPSLILGINRAGTERDVTLEPDYDPAHVVLGIQYGFIQPDGQRIKSVQFLKKEVSPEGIEHEAVYDFRDLVRISTKCHWWGEKVLVVEWDIFNDQKSSSFPVRAENVKVTSNKGDSLELLTPEDVVGLIYKKDNVYAAAEAKFHWKKKEAQEILEEMRMIANELSQHQMTSADVPPKTRFYGVLYFAMNPLQAPVSISAKFSKEVLTSKFEFGEEISHHYYPEPDQPREESESEGPPPAGASEDYDVLL